MDDLGSRELEPVDIVGEVEPLGVAGEGDIGLHDHEFVDERGEPAVADLEHVEFIAEEDCVEHLARGGEGAPAVEAAEVVHGQVPRIVVGDAGERPRRRVPYRAEEVGYLPAVEDDGEDERWEEEREEDLVVELPVTHDGVRGGFQPTIDLHHPQRHYRRGKKNRSLEMQRPQAFFYLHHQDHRRTRNKNKLFF